MGQYWVDTCSLWVSNTFFMKNLNQIDFSKVVNDNQIFDSLMSNYNELGSHWIGHQWNWLNAIYSAFNDHYKYLIIISLVEKTLQFYDQMNISQSYDQFYSRSYLQIEKFSITELCEKLNLPKETVRRKVLELEKLGALKRNQKRIIIDRSVFSHVKPKNQLKATAKYIFLVSKMLNKENIYVKNLDIDFIENTLKNNFTLCWRWFYRMQIPMITSYHKIFSDVPTFHIWGTVAMNQAFNYKKKIAKPNIQNIAQNYMKFSESIVNNEGSNNGVSAMSISDMTNIPRATVIRKCKYLMEQGYLKINDKKQYLMTGLNIAKIIPFQQQVLKNKCKFLRKIFNLLTIS
jgi:hypothetical protein